MAGNNLASSIEAWAQQASGMAEAVHALGDSVNALTQASYAVAQAAQIMSAPRRIVRDQTGRAVGSESLHNG